MVKATSAVALAVLAMTASTFARPVGASEDLIARDSEFDVEARDYNYDVEAREVEDSDFYAREFELAEEDARELEDDYEARDFEDFEDNEARDYEDFEDYEARDYDDWEDMFERDPPAASTTSAPSSTITAAPTPSATTVIATKNGKPTKTIISYVQPTGCRKPGLLGRIRNAIRNRRNKKKNRSSSSASPSSTSASGTITSSASATSTLKPTVRDRTSKGADGTRTINRTITAAQTPCPENKKRSLEIDELD